MRQNYKMNTNNSEYEILHSVKENVLTWHCCHTTILRY